MFVLFQECDDPLGHRPGHPNLRFFGQSRQVRSDPEIGGLSQGMIQWQWFRFGHIHDSAGQMSDAPAINRPTMSSLARFRQVASIKVRNPSLLVILRIEAFLRSWSDDRNLGAGSFPSGCTLTTSVIVGQRGSHPDCCREGDGGKLQRSTRLTL